MGQDPSLPFRSVGRGGGGVEVFLYKVLGKKSVQKELSTNKPHKEGGN